MDNIIYFTILLLLIILYKSSILKSRREYIDIVSNINIPIYVISLKKALDRRDYIDNIFKKFGVSFTYFDGIDGANMTEEDKLLASKYIDDKCEMPLGAVGCYLSHVLLLKHLQKSEIEHALVLEDDVSIDNSNTFLDIKKSIMPNYDVIFLGHCGERPGKYVTEFYKVYESVRPRCTHAYLISKNGVGKMLELIENNKSPKAIDHVYAESKLNNYSLFPQLINQKGLKSYIGNTAAYKP